MHEKEQHHSCSLDFRLVDISWYTNVSGERENAHADRSTKFKTATAKYLSHQSSLCTKHKCYACYNGFILTRCGGDVNENSNTAMRVTVAVEWMTNNSQRSGI